ncbi:acylphosphatase [Rhodobacteraceae bacterium RKSG542]|uniref:acylphosphatase n=1 Tax=Pseudovibrio flavus TaxID=2529854 RepID=UPI0012BCED1C|nr:acylphosphatase [Pseudovibrio flavus]MTI16411.1 acylphosphatase [Pseudovibrio flavus]
MQSLHISISGRVQGVGYRAWFLEKARGLGLSGWVKNCDDGRVEAVISGPYDKVEALILAAHQGPTFARVDGVERIGEPEVFEGPFEVR